MKFVNKKWTYLIILVLLCSTIGLAWYENNKQARVTIDNTVTVKSSGALKVALVTKDLLNEPILVDDAVFDSTLYLTYMSKAIYKDVTGDGIRLYTAKVGANGTVDSSNAADWGVAEADDVSDDDTSGHYALVDVYFQSESPMDIYLLGGSDGTAVQPIGNTLVTTYGSGTLQKSAYLPNVLALNECDNPSSFGFFSQNNIAAATRVAFIEETITKNGTDYIYEDPYLPQVVYVPNANGQLTRPADPENEIYTYNTAGTKESWYSYYVENNNNSIISYSLEKINYFSGYLLGKIYRVENGNYNEVSNIYYHQGSIYPRANGLGYYPGVFNSSTDNYDTGIIYQYANGKYKVVLADYASTNNGAYVIKIDNVTYHIIKKTVGSTISYVSAVLSSDGKYYVEDTGSTQKSWTRAEMDTIVRNIPEDAEYVVNNWINDSNLNKKVDSSTYVSCVPIATTKSFGSGSTCFTRVKIVVWIEGTDRESDIALNGGQFKIDLQFYGVLISS